MRYLLLLLLFVTNNIFSQQAKPDSLFQTQKDFSGVILIAENNKPVYYKAFGYREFETQIPLQKTDIFELASVSKQFTAMMIMMLKEKGMLNYDDSVSKYLEIPYKGITI